SVVPCLLKLPAQCYRVNKDDEKAPDSAAKVKGESAKKGYVGIHTSGFRDILLKPELVRPIVDSIFEHPFEGILLNSIFPGDGMAPRSPSPSN
ncbi:hypothetical protein ABKV19_026058, partial [Rosa sericea]